LFVARESGEIVLDDARETGEATAQPVEPARHWLHGARCGDVAKAIGAPVTDRAEPEEAIFAKQKPDAGEAGRAAWRDAAPRHSAGVGRRRGAQREGAHRGRDPVGTNGQVVSAGFAVAKGD